jgi:hypothetical protein
MPFKGHRTCQQVREDAERRNYDQLPWCPAAYRDFYHSLRAKGFSAAETRPLIEEQIAWDERRAGRAA